MKTDHVKEAAHAHSTLNTLAAVVALLENGLLYNPETEIVTSKIIKVCQKEQRRLLGIYDLHRAQAADELARALARAT